MKKTAIIMAVILGLVYAGCSDKQKEQAQIEKQKQDSIKTADSMAQAVNNQKMETAKIERRKKMQAGDTFGPEKAEASLENKIKEGKVILMSDEGETIPIKMEGSRALAMTMPDGKLYPVEMNGEKIIVTIPGHGKMERQMINGKMYLVDNDDKMYEVKVMDKKLVAVLNDGTKINLAKK